MECRQNKQMPQLFFYRVSTSKTLGTMLFSTECKLCIEWRRYKHLGSMLLSTSVNLYRVSKVKTLGTMFFLPSVCFPPSVFVMEHLA
jgi:hypothetical protein